MKIFKRLIALSLLAFLVWTCNTSDSTGPDTISLTLSDSLKSILKKDDSLVVLRFDIKGSGTNDTLFQDTLYHGLYNSPDQLGNLQLPPPTLSNFLIVFNVYRNGQKILSRELAFTNGKPGTSQGISISIDSTKKVPVDTVTKPKGRGIVAVNPKTINFNVGGLSTTLHASITPDSMSQAVIWKSTDSTIATVTPGGLVTPVKVGRVVIRARSVADTSALDSASINVQAAIATSVQILNSSPLSLPFNDSGTTLEAQVYPTGSAQEVSWSISDSTIASVNVQGRIVTYKLGQAQIIAKVKSNPTLTATLTLSVIQPNLVTNITVKPDSMTLFLGGAPGQLTVGMTPADSTNVAQYRSGDIAVANVSNGGKVTAVTPGLVEIYANPLGYLNLKDSCKVTVKKDPPILTAGNDRQINIGDTVIFPLHVTQIYGNIQALKWDFNGDGVWEDSTKASGSDTIVNVGYRYSQAGTFQAAFYVRDGEGNVTTVTRRVLVGSKAPFVDIIKPSAKDTTIKVNRFTLVYLVDTVQFTKFLTLLEGFNHIVVSDTGKTSGLVGTDTVNIRVDSKPPIVKITSPTKGFITKNATVPVTWTVDGGPVQSNSEPLGGKQDSIKIVRAGTDSVGNQASDTVIIVRDTIPPGPPIFITSSGASPDTTNARQPNWQWKSAGGGNHSFHIILQDSLATVITDTNILDTLFQAKRTLSDGRYPLSVSESDLAGNVSSTAKRTVVVRTVGPNVKITSPVGGLLTNLNSVAVVWIVNAVNQASQTTEDLTGKSGPVMIRRQATDALGNIGADSVSITVDRSIPNAPSVITPPTPTRNTKPTWSWASTGGGGNGTFQYQLDTNTAVVTTALSFTPITSLDEGTHSLKIQERNNASTWSAQASSSVLIKSAPLAPVVSVTAALTNSPKWTWVPASSSGGNGNYVYQVDGGTNSAAQSVTQYAPVLSEGSHTLCVSEQDVIGAGAQGCKTLQVDLTAPALSITAPTGMAKVFSNNPNASGTASDANGIKTISYILNSGTPQSFAFTSSPWALNSIPWAEDRNILVVTITDNAGNPSTVRDTVYKKSNVIFVRKTATGDGTSWANAFGEMNKPLSSSASISGKSIWVSAGTYSPTAAQASLGNGMYIWDSDSLYGGFPSDGSAFLTTMRDPLSNLTDIQDPTGQENLVSVNGDNILIHGFVFEKSGGTFSSSGNSGIKIIKCTFRNFDNSSESTPVVVNSDGTTLIDSCLFSKLRYTHKGALQGSGFTISNSTFSSNQASYNAGGLTVQTGGDVVMHDMTFLNNYIEDPVTFGLTFVHVSASGGNLIYQKSTCSFDKNGDGVLKNDGSGISEDGGSVVAY